MKYKEFIKSTEPNLIENLFVKLGYLNNQIKFVPINNYPDYDMSPYEGRCLNNYYFKNKWCFKNDFDSIINASIIDSALFHADCITDIAKEYSLNLEFKNDRFTTIVEQAYEIDKDSFCKYSHKADINDFKLNELRIISIDNVNRYINYDGTFFGDMCSIESPDCKLISKIEIIGVNRNFNELEFYKQLLVEAFILNEENRYKLSFFVTYSALENFVNTQMDCNDKRSRFNDKLKKLFKSYWKDISSHSIYNSLMNDFSSYTGTRNKIAHGKNQIEINEKNSKSLLRFVLILIASYTWKDETFKELYTRLK